MARETDYGAQEDHRTRWRSPRRSCGLDIQLRNPSSTDLPGSAVAVYLRYRWCFVNRRPPCRLAVLRGSVTEFDVGLRVPGPPTLPPAKLPNHSQRRCRAADQSRKRTAELRRLGSLYCSYSLGCFFFAAVHRETSLE